MLKVIEIQFPEGHRPAFNALMVSSGKLVALVKLDGVEIRSVARLNGASLVFEVSKDALPSGRWIELTPLPNGRALKTELDVKRVWHLDATHAA